jgi:rRNA pseudouridine-1189 N-methylase Emg1 (Nep1/Mra1 family)
MEQLYKKNHIQTTNQILLSLEAKSLNQLLSEQKGRIILLWEKGEKSSFSHLCAYEKDSPLTVVIGGFPHGDFYSASRLVDKKVSLGSDPLTASYLLAKTICTFEQLYFEK